MSKVYIVSAKRTPFGAFSGALSDVPAPKLAAACIENIIADTKILKEDIDEVIIGQVLTGGVGQAPARQAMRFSGIPDSVPAMTVNKVCGSGLKSVMLAADSIRLGNADLVIAGGMENMSLAPYILPKARNGFRMGDGSVVDSMIHDALIDPYGGNHMGVITEAWIESHKLTREEQDDYAIRSYELAQKAIESGVFDGEIVPVIKSTRKGDVTVDKDEDPFNVVFDKIKGLRPVFKKDGTITAANASSINDGAGIVLLASAEAVEKYNLTPVARLVSYATNSIHPDLFAEAPVGAVQKALGRAGLTVNDIAKYEINEAFSAVPLVAVKELGLDIETVNCCGGAVSIGHPVGASGARLVATLVNQLKRSDERYGVATLCIGGGEGVAAVIERI